MFETEKEVERVILVAVDDGTNEFDAESCLDELEDLANTADAAAVSYTHLAIVVYCNSSFSFFIFN